MSSLNKVCLLGRVGQDPEIRASKTGDKCANISLATSETWKDKAGQKQEKTEWHKIVIWGKLAEIAEKYVKKGSQIYIEGQLQTRKWQDKDGNDRYNTEIILQGFNANLILLSGNKDNNQSKEKNNSNYNADDLNDEIPF